MGRRTLVAALFLLVASIAAPSEGAWLQIRAGNVLFLSDASEAELRQTVERFDQFREVIGRAFPAVITSSPVPTVVVLFQSGRAFGRYRPAVDGHVVTGVRGYFVAADDINYLAMNAEAGDEGLRVLFHEYAHFLIGNTAGRTPAWFDEGVAQVYETLAVSDDRTAAIVGVALAQHVRFLQNARLLPLEEVLAVERALDLFEDRRRQRAFYAQAWALAHYLLLGNERRAPQLAEYLEYVQRGDPPAAAFTAAFDTTVAQLEIELRAYVRQFRFPARGFRFADQIARRPLLPARPVEQGEVDAWLADLLARAGQPDEARRRLERLVREQPQNARAAAVLGTLHRHEGRQPEGLPLLARAAALAPDDPIIQAAYGASLYGALADLDSPASNDETFARARAVLSRAAALDERSAPVRVRLGYLALAAGDLDDAEAAFERALALAPARHDYRQAIADVLVRRGELGRAAEALRLVARRGAPDVAARARARLSEIEAPGARTAIAEAPPSFQLRVPASGEQQAAGRLVAVECSGPLQTYRVQDGDRVYRFVRPVGGTDLRTHRADSPRALGCGVLPEALPAVVTFILTHGRDPEVVEGVAIALELVPDDHRDHGTP